MRSLRSLAVAVALMTTGPAVSPADRPGGRRGHPDLRPFGTTSVSGGRYIVQNNEWGDSIQQCLDVTDDGFSVTTGDHNVPRTAPPARVSVDLRGLPLRQLLHRQRPAAAGRGFGNPQSSVNFTTAAGQWDASYDIWFDPSPTRPARTPARS